MLNQLIGSFGSEGLENSGMEVGVLGTFSIMTGASGEDCLSQSWAVFHGVRNISNAGQICPVLLKSLHLSQKVLLLTPRFNKR